MAHTPGPWTHDYSGKDGKSTGMGCGYGQSQIIDSKGRALAGVAAVEPDDGSPMYEAGGLSQATFDLLEANARLIAAAPELLAALVALLPLSETRDGHLYGSEFVAADAAIAKATQA